MDWVITLRYHQTWRAVKWTIEIGDFHTNQPPFIGENLHCHAADCRRVQEICWKAPVFFMAKFPGFPVKIFHQSNQWRLTERLEDTICRGDKP